MNLNSLVRIHGRFHVAALLLMIAGGSGCDTFLASVLPDNSQQISGAVGTNQQSDADNNNEPLTPSVAATLLEQLSLERINRARLRPAEEAAAGGIAIDEGIPGRLDATSKPAVVMNTRLRLSATGHSHDMLDRDYFQHETLEGVSPFERIQDAGYVFLAAGENLAWRGSTGTLNLVQTVEAQHNDLFVDQGIPGRGHRVTMLNPQLREVGIAIIRGSFTRPDDGVVFSDSIMQTQDYGTAPASPTFVLGVVYQDNNSNAQYDYGEGVANSPISLGDIVKSTNQAGGYSFAVGVPDTYTLTFASGRTLDITIGIGDPNIKVDSVSGQPVVNLGLGLLN